MFRTLNNRQKGLNERDLDRTTLGHIELPNFDDMVKLANERPHELEAIRQRVCKQLIDSAPAHLRERLNGLQFKINMERELANSPMSACLKLSAMMNESLHELRELLSNPEEYLRHRARQTAEVIPFQRPE